MPFFPTLDMNATSRDVTDVFLGYNHNLRIQNGEFFETKNLTSSFYPMLSPRNKRGQYLKLSKPGGLLEKDALAYVDAGTLYYNFQPTPITGLSEGEKQLVSFGAYILIFPDKTFFNTEDPSDYGSMEAHYSYSGSVQYDMCHYDGTPYTAVYKGDSEPSHESFELWIRTSAGTTSTVVYTYSYSDASWVELNTVYTKITFPTYGQLPAQLNKDDGVTISGSTFEPINGYKILYGVGGSETEKDYIVVVHQLDSQQVILENETVSIDRNIPNMDFVIECQNRLWGCFYGYDRTTDSTLNEIYCCSLGDFKNWSQYLGVSTDSWTGSVGSDGEWTGAINYLGYPTFFKENHIHVVSISTVGAHQINETPCRGVQKGSHKSLIIVNETLYYKSRTDICAYQGSFPSGVSDALGDIKYYDAVAGSFGEKYYISMRNANDEWAMFVFDISKGMWLHEDDLHATAFAKVDDELYCTTHDGNLLGLNGINGTLEPTIEWSCETGILTYESPDMKYVSRFDFRVKGERGAKIDIYIQYDSEGGWIHSGTVRQLGVNTVVVPIRPRRCDHLRIRLIGVGNMKVYSISKILEVGSDV